VNEIEGIDIKSFERGRKQGPDSQSKGGFWAEEECHRNSKLQRG